MNKLFKVSLILSTFLIFPNRLKADLDLLNSSPSFDSITRSNSINSGIDKYRASENNWGEIGKEAEVDLSEWGGKAPSCSEAPGCPVCIK